MGRKIILQSQDGRQLLEETAADDEAQLQDLLKENPDLLPIEDFELSGPVMVVGRETTLASGARVDLVCLARSGHILVIEFKTGPDNSDFRRAAAQLLDYGSHLWGRRFDEFESAVAVRYFGSDRCPKSSPVWAKKSLQEAALAQWPGVADEWPGLRQKIEDQLESGSFVFVLAAQRFHPATERTLLYLNEVAAASRFYGVELVRFDGEGVTAFEARTVIRPLEGRSGQARTAMHEDRFLEQVQEEHRSAFERLFETCRGLDLRFEWGSRGVSIRLPTADRAEPLSVGWVFPPGVSGWMGLTDVTLGVDSGSAAATPSVSAAVAAYLVRAATIPGAKSAKAKNVEGWTFDGKTVSTHLEEILAALTELVTSTSGS